MCLHKVMEEAFKKSAVPAVVPRVSASSHAVPLMKSVAALNISSVLS